MSEDLKGKLVRIECPECDGAGKVEEGPVDMGPQLKRCDLCEGDGYMVGKFQEGPDAEAKLLSEHFVASALSALLQEFANDPDLIDTVFDDDDGTFFQDVDTAATFADADVMSANEGFVVKLDTGAEFQITVVKSKNEGGA